MIVANLLIEEVINQVQFENVKIGKCENDAPWSLLYLLVTRLHNSRIKLLSLK
jgi:hypothetical protein